jgi:phosphate starvation-inducible protein PhoH and related proteins
LHGEFKTTLTTNLQLTTQTLSLQPEDNQRLANLCGSLDEHIKLIEKQLGIEIHNRGSKFQLRGDSNSVTTASSVLTDLYKSTTNKTMLTPNEVHLVLQNAGAFRHAGNMLKSPDFSDSAASGKDWVITTKRSVIKPRGENQKRYVANIHSNDVNFGIGPAGTGKTYLAVACAVNALEKDEVRRIVLVRPAVEAGEKLGFLPGDMAQKVDPYLRPLYDALYEMLGFETVDRLIEKNVIEVAPLAYMRGRTLNDAFIILDESQNTTKEQMKMFLTRIGFGSHAVITGDASQVDLPQGKLSGLVHAIQVLDGIKEIGFTYFKAQDVVRHTLVQRIVEAYDSHDEQNNNAPIHNLPPAEKKPNE